MGGSERERDWCGLCGEVPGSPSSRVDFCGRMHQMLTLLKGLRLRAVEEVRMVADLPQLHDGVSQLLGLPARHRRVHHEAVVLLDAFVDGLLMGTQLNFDDELDLLRQVLGHIFLYSAEEEGP